MTATKEEIDRIATIVKGSRVALLTTTNSEGQLVSRPLAIQDVPFEGDLWFFSQDPTDKTADIAQNSQVNVACESGKGYLSVAGHASVVHDRAKIDELWNTATEAWFPDGKDETVALIKVEADTVEYWSTDDPKPVILLKAAKAAVTGGQPDVGENATVRL